MEQEQSTKDVGSLGTNGSTLIYTGRNITRVPEVFSKLHGSTVEHLDLSYNNINRLEGLKGFAILKELILDNNEIDDNVEFSHSPTLKTLSLNNNKITDLTSFIHKVVKCFPNLAFLSLLGNKACQNELSDRSKDEDDYQRYRFYVLYHLRKLKFLDSSAVTQKELEEAISKGKFMQIRKPKVLQEERPYFSPREPDFEPLPTVSRPIGDHRGAYTAIRQRYSNKDSEGNRYIVNNDL